MDSLGIDNNTREMVWKITPKPKNIKKKTATAPKTKVTDSNKNIKEMVDSQIKNLSSILFEKMQELEQEVKKLRVKNTVLESRVTNQDVIDDYSFDTVYQPWYL